MESETPEEMAERRDEVVPEPKTNRVRDTKRTECMTKDNYIFDSK